LTSGGPLSGLAAELAQIAHSTEKRAEQARQPIDLVRTASLLAILVGTL
jgi:hypothetical protein